MGIHRRFSVASLASAPLLCPFIASAPQSEIIETVKTGCANEIEKHCKDVTPGESRVLACLYAYQDKLSTRCEYALYDASARLERSVAALAYVASACSAALESYCAAVTPGGGRIMQGMRENEAKLSARCKVALEDTREEIETVVKETTKSVGAGQSPAGATLDLSSNRGEFACSRPC